MMKVDGISQYWTDLHSLWWKIKAGHTKIWCLLRLLLVQVMAVPLPTTSGDEDWTNPSFDDDGAFIMLVEIVSVSSTRCLAVLSSLPRGVVKNCLVSSIHHHSPRNKTCTEFPFLLAEGPSNTVYFQYRPV